MIFISTAIGIVFIALGAFLIYRGVVYAADRERLLTSGVGAVAVGIGNILLPRSALASIAALLIGGYLILSASRLRRP